MLVHLDVGQMVVGQSSKFKVAELIGWATAAVKQILIGICK